MWPATAMSTITPSHAPAPAGRLRRALPLALAPILVGLTVACREETSGEAGAGTDPSASSQEQEPISYLVGPQAGRWHEVRTHRYDPGLTDQERQEIAELESIGYSDGLHDAPEHSGVVRYDPERAAPGVNLYTSAHEAMSALIDMEGHVLHRWRFPFRKAFPRYPFQNNKLATFWRRAFVQPNGDLLAIYEGLGLIKIDRNSKLLWKNGNRAHHDLQVMPDGTIWVLTRQAHVLPRISKDQPVLEDFVTELGPNGRTLREISVLSALEGSPFDQNWSERIGQGGDLFHTNTLEVLDGSLEHVDPAFRKGNLLVSMLLLDLVAVIDVQTEKVVWGHVGPYARQHDPHVLPSGTILVFDNQGLGEASRVLELDPATWEVRWSYEGRPSEPFYSETCGLAQRLEGGNTLITETDFGRAFEVTPEGQIVWEFYNPHRAGQDGRFIATLMEVERLPPDFPTDWAREQ